MFRWPGIDHMEHEGIEFLDVPKIPACSKLVAGKDGRFRTDFNGVSAPDGGFGLTT